LSAEQPPGRDVRRPGGEKRDVGRLEWP
jgi:hypothetical protein